MAMKKSVKSQSTVREQISKMNQLLYTLHKKRTSDTIIYPHITHNFIVKTHLVALSVVKAQKAVPKANHVRCVSRALRLHRPMRPRTLLMTERRRRGEGAPVVPDEVCYSCGYSVEVMREYRKNNCNVTDDIAIINEHNGK